jgi:hypothetical protein
VLKNTHNISKITPFVVEVMVVLRAAERFTSLFIVVLDFICKFRGEMMKGYEKKEVASEKNRRLWKYIFLYNRGLCCYNILKIKNIS